MRNFFKFYFCLLIIFYLVAIVLTIGDEEPISYFDGFDLIVGLVTMVGIFGYAYSKKILNAFFWKCYLPLIVIWDGYNLYDLIVSDSDLLTEDFGIWFLVFMSFIFVVLLVPSYVAIYLYGREKE